MSTQTETPPLEPARPGSLPELVQREEKRRRRRWIGWVAAIVAVPVLVALGWVALRPRPVPLAQRFRTAPVTRGDVVREVRATGHLEAASTVDVGAEISGKIASVDVDFNDHVTKGQVLARFDRAGPEAQAAQADANVRAAQAALSQARIDAAQAKANLVRSNSLIARGAETPAEHENAQTAAQAATARVAAAQAQLSAAKAASETAHTNLDHTIVRSPIDGIVISRKVDPGQTVISALQTPVLFTVAADLSHMKVLAAVDEADVAEVKPAQPVEFTVTAWPDRTFEGRVIQVRNSPEVVQDVVTYGTEIAVENPDLALKPGMTASVRIRTADAKDTLRVPTAALRFLPPGEPEPAEGPPQAVWVISDGALKRVPVQAGVSDGEQTAVSAPGLRIDEKVLVDLTPEGKAFYGRERS